VLSENRLNIVNYLFFIPKVEEDIKFGNGYNIINFGKWMVICNLELYHSEKKI
jgi:hypothetical protein